MQTRRIARTDLDVSVIGLGCNNFGRIDQAATQTVVDASLENGINFFDTADMYGDGLSEQYLGKALGERRKDVIILTKFGARSGGARDNVNACVEASLQRIGTDYIDLYMLHFPDAKTPILETLEALNALITAGKVRHIACSNFSTAQLEEADRVAKDAGLIGFASTEEDYSILKRDIEAEVLPTIGKLGVSLLPYFPLASGLLTGKYRRGETPGEDTRYGKNPERFGKALSDENFDRVDRLTSWAEARGHSILELAFAWLLADPKIPSVIAGATRPEQVKANAAAGSWILTAAEQDEVRQLAL
jgi:aryl-alcohol dehydrogenase-like predicted oxidoreductase